MTVFRKVDEIYWKSRNKPWQIRLLLRLPWLQALQWWHVLVATALVIGGVIALLMMRPTADSDTRVIARVDDSPISEADLIAEAGGPVAAEQHKRLIDAVIDRRLLAAAAGREPAGHGPVAMAASRRAEETVLAAAIARRIVGEVKADDAAARNYIAAHPAMFGQRQVVLVDAGPIDPGIANGPALREATTLEQADIALRPTGANFVHERRVIDTGSVPAELAAQLVAVAPGRLFLMPMGGRAMLGAVIQRTPLVMPDAIQLEQARAGAMAEIQQARLMAALKAMRAKAVIRLNR